MRWRGFLNAAFGFWLISSPFTFAYQSEQLIWSDVICGILAIIFGLLTVHFSFICLGNRSHRPLAAISASFLLGA